MLFDDQRNYQQIQIQWTSDESTGDVHACGTEYSIREMPDGRYKIYESKYLAFTDIFASIDDAKTAINKLIQHFIDHCPRGWHCSTCGSGETFESGEFKCSCGTDDEISRQIFQRQRERLDQYLNGELPPVKLRWKRHREKEFYVAFGTGRIVYRVTRKKWSPNWGDQDIWVAVILGSFIDDCIGHYNTLSKAIRESEFYADQDIANMAMLHEIDSSLKVCLSCTCRVRESRGAGQFACRCGTPDEHKWPLGFVHQDPYGYIPGEW